jgi:hypothetical protein
VQSVRIALTTDEAPTQHSEMLWEVSCPQDAYHYKWHMVDSSATANNEINRDEMHVGNVEYDRQSDDSWLQAKYPEGLNPKNLCSRLNQGSDNGMMPAIATMIKRGILQKGDKKTVSGVRCREWHVTFKAGRGLEHDTVCLGLDDHLPYEMIVDSRHLRTVYSDYNSLPLTLPKAAVQPASVTSSSN